MCLPVANLPASQVHLLRTSFHLCAFHGNSVLFLTGDSCVFHSITSLIKRYNQRVGMFEILLIKLTATDNVGCEGPS